MKAGACFVVAICRLIENEGTRRRGLNLRERFFDRLTQWQIDFVAILFQAAFAGGTRICLLLIQILQTLRHVF